MTLYDRLGGDPVLRLILSDFYDRVFADAMIGFLFEGRDRRRLVMLEAQFTARALGADIPYEGRDMRRAHAGVRVLPGHFHRRHRLLEETLDDHRVDPEVRSAWLAHSRALQPAVVAPDRGDHACDEPSTVRPRP